MATLSRKPAGPDPAKLYTPVLDFLTDTGTPGFVANKGARYKGDHPVVRAFPQLFLEDGADDLEIGAARAELYFGDGTQPEPPPPQPAPERRLRDADALVSIDTGERVPKKSQAARKHPEKYVPVVPPGVKREQAYGSSSTATTSS